MEIFLGWIAILGLAFYFLIARPQRRRVNAHRAFIAALELGDEVVTTGGIYGTVRALRGDAVELEIAPGVAIRVARAAIAQRVMPAGGGGPDDVPEHNGAPHDDDGGR